MRGDATSWAVMARGRRLRRDEKRKARASELVAASRSRRQARQEQLGGLKDQATHAVRDGEAAAEPSFAKARIQGGREGAGGGRTVG